MSAVEPRSIWTLAEASDGAIHPVSFEVLARATALQERLANSRVTAVLLAPSLSNAALARLIHHGADEVLHVRDDRLAHVAADDAARILTELVEARRPEIFLAAATTFGRTVMPYLSVRLNAGLTADCTVLEIEPESGALLQTRPAIGGNILATIRTPEARPQMATVRPNSTPVAPPDLTRTGLITEVTPDGRHFQSPLQYVGFDPIGADETPISEARSVVSGGRGLGRGESFGLVRDLADVLRASVGASREAVDRGWISYPHQVGLSGKTVTPELYVALGISGSIQHLAGMQTSRRIVAINSDADAQIFRVADLGVVGDLFAIVPLLIDRLRERTDAQAGEEVGA